MRHSQYRCTADAQCFCGTVRVHAAHAPGVVAERHHITCLGDRKARRWCPHFVGQPLPTLRVVEGLALRFERRNAASATTCTSPTTAPTSAARLTAISPRGRKEADVEADLGRKL